MKQEEIYNVVLMTQVYPQSQNYPQAYYIAYSLAYSQYPQIISQDSPQTQKV